MNRSNHAIQFAVAAMVLGTGSLFAAPANAADVLRSNYQNMGANCHAADSWDDVTLMERNALGYRNTSNSNSSSNNVVVVCNFLTDVFATSNPVGTTNTVLGVYLYARAWRNRNVNMTCVATAGYATSPDNITLTKSFALTGDGEQKYVGFNAVDNGGNWLQAPVNVVCTVPGGVELNDAAVFFYQDVGN